MFKFLNLMNFWIFGWASLGILFCSSDIVELCFGTEYILPLKIVIVLSCNFYIVGMLNAVWTFKTTLGLFHYGRFIQLILGVLNILLSILLGKCWGLFGILLATTISRALTNTWYDPYAVFKYGFNKSPLLYLGRYIEYFVVLLIIVFINYTIFSFINGSLIFRLILKIIICSIITNIVFFLAFHRSKEFNKLKCIVCNSINIALKKVCK